MKITYTGEGASVEEPKVWPWRPERLLVAEAEAIENATGMDYGSEFIKKMMAGNMHALHAALWVLRKRETPNLRYADVVFALGDVTLGFDDDELADIAAELDRTADEEKRRALQHTLDLSGWVPPEPDPTTAVLGTSS